MRNSILRSIGIVTLIVSLMWACQNELTISVPEFKSQLVLNSFLKPGEQIIVHVTASQNILEKYSENPIVTDAKVIVTNQDDLSYSLEHTGDGHYTLPGLSAQYNSSYTITVEADDFKTASGSTTIPVQVFVNAVPEFVIQNDEIYNEINLSITDETKNQYFIWEIFDEGDEDAIYSALNFESVRNVPTRTSTHDSEIKILDNSDLQSRIFVDGSSLRDQDYSTKFLVAPRTGSATTNSNGEIVEEKQKKLRVMTVSDELYEYLKSIEIYRVQVNANSILTEPYTIYSNVDNGLGIIAGYSEEIFDLN